MAWLTEAVEWVENLYRIELDDPVEGGEDGIDNINAKKLGARTRYLKGLVEPAVVLLADVAAGLMQAGAYLHHTRPSTDVRPPPTQIIAGRATSLTAGSTTAANKVGPHIVTELGRAQTEGTDAPGGWWIGFGNAVSNTIANGLIFGQGASIGTPGTDAYRPFTTEVGRLRGVAGYLQMTGDFLAISAVSQATLQANAITMQAFAGGANLTASGNFSSNAAAHKFKSTLTSGLGFQSWAVDRRFDFGGSDEVVRAAILCPTAVITASTSLALVFTLTLGTTLKRWRIWLLTESSAGAAWQSQCFEVTGRLRSGTVEFAVTGASVIEDPDQTLQDLDVDVSDNGSSGLAVSITPPTSTTLTHRADILELT